MREIKFRGKGVITNNWFEGSLLTTEDGGIIYGKSVGGVKKETIGQYTGLKDKNGKEIYEGDILTWSKNEIESSPLVIEYKHGAFGYTYSEGSFIALAGNSNFAFNPFDNDKRFQIIGNIHDNPELIKEVRQ